MNRNTFLALPLALAVAHSNAAAQQQLLTQPAPRIDYALTNVRIVSAPGRVIERGTVLVQNGRIAAVGAQVTIPAGVTRMDLTGHSVFPGLIDAATSIGLPSPTRALPAAGAAADAGRGRGAAGGRGAAPAGPARGGPGAAPVVLPEIDAAAEAAEMFLPTPDELASLRAGGVTTVGLVFNGGLFPGRVGAALTGAQDESRLVLRTGVGQEVSFGTLRGGYPGTGIGAIAYVRQGILDAQYEVLLDKAFRAGNPGARPTFEPLSRAMLAAAAGEMPFWFVASQERPINRVAEIVKELGLKNPVVVGVQEGWRSTAALKQSGATAVVSVDWGAGGGGGRGGGRGGGGAAGGGLLPPTADAGPPVDPRANALSLAKAGIPIALASFGGESGAAFRDRIRSTIEAGLPPDEALRAATVTAATLLGINAAVGTIENGKLANLVVVTGNDLFAAGTPIRHVFVEGRLYTVTSSTPQRGAGPGDGPRPSQSNRGS